MSFQKNDIIVREDHRYPDDALVVDGYGEDGDLLAHPLGGGFQIKIPKSEQHRFSMVNEEEKTPLFTAAKFVLDGLAVALLQLRLVVEQIEL